MTRWWRAYDGSIDHPKLLKLSDKMFRAWYTLQCVASANGGTLPPAEDIAIRLRAKKTDVAGWITQLVSAKLIDNENGVFRPHNWDERQFQSDNSTGRVAKYREKRRAAGLPQMGDYSVFRPSLVQRDGERCVYCEVVKGLVVDHMVPIALGGTDHPDNLALACKPCNSGKSGRTPELAGMTVKVTSALAALTRYRDSMSDVTVTATPSEHSIAESDSEQNTTGARALDENGLKNEKALSALFTALCLNLNRAPPDLRPITGWLLDGIAMGTISTIVTPILKRKVDMVSLSYCDSAVREAHSRLSPNPDLQVVSSQVFVIVGTLAHGCWDRYSREHGGRGYPVTQKHIDNVLQEGWYHATEFPPGYDEATGEKLAPRSEEDDAA